MDIKLPRGKYVLAVSGGVDSMTLLDLLSNTDGVELVAAHFNHDIRSDSPLDEEMVAKTAAGLGIVFESGHGHLGAAASEEVARRARYDFLEKTRRKYRAKAIITAHHQDDLIETALINTLRGTNRRGLTAITGNSKVVRPLLKFPKSEILEYAKARNLDWREDATNQDTDYLRNYLRLKILPTLSAERRTKLLKNIDELSSVNRSIDDLIATLSRQLRQKDRIDRHLFSLLSDNIARELLVYWIREDGLGDVDKYEINRLNLALKTAKAGTQHAIKGPARLVLDKQTARFKTTP